MRSSDSPLDQQPSSLNRILTWATLIMIVITIPLVLGFVGRVQADTRVTEEVQHRTLVVNKAEGIYTGVQRAVAYAKTSEFTERYAREIAHLARPGEVVVIPPDVQDASRPPRAWWQEFMPPDASAPISDTNTIR